MFATLPVLLELITMCVLSVRFEIQPLWDPHRHQSSLTEAESTVQ